MNPEQFQPIQPQERGSQMADARVTAAIEAASKKYNVDSQKLSDLMDRVATYRDRFIKGANDARNAVLDTDFRGNSESDKKLRGTFSRAIRAVQDQLEPQEA
jgi:hypothetical protein